MSLHPMRPDTHLTITGGIYRGRRLHAPDNIRPTSQKAREALMSKLVSLWGGPVDGYVADICAGSGALGFDLMSRGAQHATFVDINVKAVQANAQLLGIASDRHHVIRQNALHTLPPWPHVAPLDVLVTDPPYSVAPIQMWANAWLHWVVTDYTVVCIEQETEHITSAIEGLELLQQTAYGRATWTIWQKKNIITF